MRTYRSIAFLAGILALALAWGSTRPVLSAQAITPRADSFIQAEWSNFLRTDVGLRISEGVKGLAYLFRPAPSTTHRNLWQRREHPELWRTTPQEREAARAALPLIAGVAVLALLAWGAQHLVRVRRRATLTRRRERPDRHTPVAFAGGQ